MKKKKVIVLLLFVFTSLLSCKNTNFIIKQHNRFVNNVFYGVIYYYAQEVTIQTDLITHETSESCKMEKEIKKINKINCLILSILAFYMSYIIFYLKPLK